MLDKMVRVGVLFDFYGELLTPNQQKVVELHYLHDLSLGEIAEEFAVSRQAVYDVLKRAEKILEDYEKKLRLVERYLSQRQEIENLLETVLKLERNISGNREKLVLQSEVERLKDGLRKLLET